MQQEEFIVSNVKCGGCVSAIENGLKALQGVSSVSVEIDGGKVSVQGEALSRETLGAKLAELGYPEV